MELGRCLFILFGFLSGSYLCYRLAVKLTTKYLASSDGVENILEPNAPTNRESSCARGYGATCSATSDSGLRTLPQQWVPPDDQSPKE